MTTPAPFFMLIVHGIPAPQGSKKQQGSRITKAGNKIPRLVESSAKVKPWREAVDTAARKQIARLRWVKLDGPIEAEIFFTLPRPASVKATARPYPTVYPDLSKLLRSTEDALTTAGVWADDARVIRYRGLDKSYPGGGIHALDQPGAIIRVWRAEL